MASGERVPGINLCAACHQGKQNLQAPTESALNILARVRKTPRSVQREIYEALKRTFGEA